MHGEKQKATQVFGQLVGVIVILLLRCVKKKKKKT